MPSILEQYMEVEFTSLRQQVITGREITSNPAIFAHLAAFSDPRPVAENLRSPY
jgi:hypothetical protein